MNFFDSRNYCKELYELIVKPLCEKHNITQMEYTILMYLNFHPQDNTATKLIKKQFLTKSHVSISIKSLQDKQLIVGEHRGNNLRTIYLRLCDSALPIIEEGKEKCKEFSDILLSGMSDEDKNQFTILLKHIINNVVDYLNRKE